MHTGQFYFACWIIDTKWATYI